MTSKALEGRWSASGGGTGLSEINPYASPLSDEQHGMIPAEPGGIWRDGPLLVMRRDAMLPDLCIKCNLPAGGRQLPRSLYWHHPLLYLVLFACSPIPFIVLALILRKSARVAIGICPAHLSRRRRAIAIGWLCALSGIPLFGMGLLESGNFAALLCVTGLVVLLVGAVYDAAVSAVISPKRIDREYVYIKGAGPEYLAQFPAWRA